MKGFVNFLVILLIAALVAAVIYVWKFLKESDPDFEADQEVQEKELREEKKKSKSFIPEGAAKRKPTVLVNMPVLSYKLPGEAWVNVPLVKARTLLGRDGNCDICIPHETLSTKQAEIVMKIHRFQKNSEEGVRYFVLKNLSKENPVSFLCGEDDWRDIAGSIPLMKSQKNIFYLGLVEMRITFPAAKRHVSEDPELEELKSAEPEHEKKPVPEASNVRKNTDTPPEPEQNEDEQLEAQLLKERKKVARRSPLSRNRI